MDELAAAGQRLNARDSEGFTPLMYAVNESKRQDAIERLLDLGAKIDVQDESGMTALDWACFNQDLKLVQLLLRRGASPNAGKGWKSSSPAYHCADRGNVEILRLLVSAGADVNRQHCGNHALNTASLYGRDEFVRVLLEAKANPNQADHSGTTPLMGAVAGGSRQVLKMLIDAGANLNAVRFCGHAETALDLAEDEKKTQTIAEYLRSVGAKRASQLPASETTPPREDETGTSWQLRDDSMLELTIEPWPPKAGSANLRVEIGPNGHDPGVPFSGTLEYRLLRSEEDSAPWKAMKRGRTDEENNIRFSEAVTLTQGSIYVQFRVHPKWDDDATTLEGWKIEVA